MKLFAIVLSVWMLFYPLCPIQTCSAASATPPHVIYLTFDDGPTDSTTPKVLDILSEKKACATFFVIGRQITRYLRVSSNASLKTGTRSASTLIHTVMKKFIKAPPHCWMILNTAGKQSSQSYPLSSKDLSLPGRILPMPQPTRCRDCSRISILRLECSSRGRRREFYGTRTFSKLDFNEQRQGTRRPAAARWRRLSGNDQSSASNHRLFSKNGYRFKTL